MIIEIALGIVLAVIILAFLPAIIAGSVGLVVIAFSLGITGLLLYSAWNNAAETGVILVCVAIVFALYQVARLVNRRYPHLDPSEILFAGLGIALWGTLSFVILESFAMYLANYPQSVGVYCAATAILGWVIRRWDRNSLKEYKRKQELADSYTVGVDMPKQS